MIILIIYLSKILIAVNHRLDLKTISTQTIILSVAFVHSLTHLKCYPIKMVYYLHTISFVYTKNVVEYRDLYLILTQ